MKHISMWTLALVLPLLMLGCADEALPTAAVEDAAGESTKGALTLLKKQITPHAVLGGTTYLSKAAQAAQAGGFAGPLFGLATAPNGDVLIADAGAGVAVLKGGAGHADIALPGVTDIGPIGRGALWATTGAGEDPRADTGQALYRAANGKARMLVNLFAFEAAHDPDGGEVPDSNPFDVASLGGRAALVADAGGNDLLRVDNQGNVEVLAVFPKEPVSTADLKNLIGCPNPAPLCNLPPMLPADPVPTSVVVGPDGYYYVGELKGFPAPFGASNIWRIAPGASWAMCGASPDCVKVFDGGFTSIIDLAFSEDGKLYVAELDEQSWFAIEVLGGGVGGSINACDLGSLACDEVATGIPVLTAITFGKDGTLWATQNALDPDNAGVVEIP